MSNVESSVTASDYARANPDARPAGAGPIRVGVIGYGYWGPKSSAIFTVSTARTSSPCATRTRPR